MRKPTTSRSSHATIGSGIFLAASIQASAALRNLVSHEFQHSLFPPFSHFTGDKLTYEKGAYAITETPGIEVEPSETMKSKMTPFKTWPTRRIHLGALCRGAVHHQHPGQQAHQEPEGDVLSQSELTLVGFGLSGFMTVFSANTFVVWGGIAYELGMVAVAINLTYGVAAMLIGYFIAGHWNKMGVDTPAEYVTLRFGKTGLHFFTDRPSQTDPYLAGSLYALAILLTAVNGDGSAIIPLNLNTAIIVFGVIVILYTMQGGLWAVLMTDVLQFIVLTVVVFVASGSMMTDLGSFANFKDNTPDGFLNLTNGDYTWFFLLGHHDQLLHVRRGMGIRTEIHCGQESQGRPQVDLPLRRDVPGHPFVLDVAPTALPGTSPRCK